MSIIPRAAQVKNSIFNIASTADEVSVGIDLKGKVALVTGASAGIGLETARTLAKRGAHVVLGVRDVAKGDASVASIIRSTGAPRSNFTVLKLDFNSFASIRSFVAEFNKTKLDLHLLINNAGIYFTPFQLSVDGYELTLAVNHLAPFLLTNLLLPNILKSTSKAFPARIVNVSSLVHQFSNIVWDNINPITKDKFDASAAYAQSKTANVLFSKELHRRIHQSTGVIVTALHPGKVITPGVQVLDLSVKQQFGFDHGVDITQQNKSPEQGAATQVWAAVHPDATISGQYVEDSNYTFGYPSKDRPNYGANEYVESPEEAKKLWDWSNKAVNESF